MRKVFLEGLPQKFQKTNWAETIGEEIDFVFDDISGKFLILDYETNGANPKVYIKYNDNFEWVYTSRLVHCKITNLVKPKNKHLSKNKDDLIGKRFGKLVVLEDDGTRSNNGSVLWKCKCDCGNITHVNGSKLKSGHIKTCGCGARVYFKPKTTTKEDVCKTAKSRIIGRYKSKAKVRNIAWSLKQDEFEECIQKPCHYCGIASSLSVSVGEHIFQYNGIDRVDSGRGYEKDNIVPCCKICNMAKSDMSQKEFYAWILRSANFIQNNRL